MTEISERQRQRALGTEEREGGNEREREWVEWERERKPIRLEG